MTAATIHNAPTLPVYSEKSGYTYLSDTRHDPFHAMQKRSEALLTPSLQLTLVGLHRISEFQVNWDGHGSAQPKAEAIRQAFFLAKFLERITLIANWPWIAPHASASEDGDITFEWWVGERKLTLYISEDNIEYIKVWGTDISNEMADGRLTDANFIELWNWLNG